MIVRNLQDDWYREYDRYVLQVHFNHLKDYSTNDKQAMIADTEVPDKDKYMKLCKIDDVMISELIHAWWRLYGTWYIVQSHNDKHLGEALHKEQLFKLCKTTGRMLQFDHTYKFSKSLGVRDGKHQVGIHSSTLVVMNEDGDILRAKIVPSDKKRLVTDILGEIILTFGKSKDSMPEAISTDNMPSDGDKLQELCNKLLPGKIVRLIQVCKIFDLQNFLCNFVHSHI